MTKSAIIRIATRKSALAWWQAEHVATQLKKLHSGLEIILIGISTQGDKILDTPLAKIGGKGLFVKELEQSILAEQADIAVHSMKDVPVELPEGLHLPVILTRDDPRDAFVSNYYSDLAALPKGSVVGTASLRRECQLRAQYPDLVVQPLRGNVNTRLHKLDAGQYDAIILASAGLRRLGFAARIRQALTPEQSLPAIGQGAIGIECRVNDQRINALIALLEDSETQVCISAERAMNLRLQGGCQVPLAGYALHNNGEVYLRGLVGTPNGQRIIRAEGRAPVSQSVNLGTQVADMLLKAGAADILTNL